jgi:hypothetical protein
MKTLKTTPVILQPVNNEGGFVLVFALIILVVLTLMGAFSTQIANNEIMTAGNQQGYLTTFYMFEGVGLEGVAYLEYQNKTGNDCGASFPTECLVKELYNVETTNLGWLDEVFSGNTSKATYDLTVTDTGATADNTVMPRVAPYPNNWTNGGVKVQRIDTPLRTGNALALEPTGYNEGDGDLVRFAVQDNGRTGIYSIGSSDPDIRGYKLYGLYDVKRGSGKTFPGRSVMEMGYRMELEVMQVL